MSYNIINSKNKTLNEFVTNIQSVFYGYNKDSLIDNNTGRKYSIQMLEESLSFLGKDIIWLYDILIFDILIGNSDRHPSNWGLIYDAEFINKKLSINYDISPIYDNGSSLCAYVNEEDIEEILRDNMRFNALLDTKSKSCVGWNDERPIRHFKLLEHLKDERYDMSINIVNKIKERINEESISRILEKYDESIISSNMKELILRYIITRKDIIVSIFERGG
ncbi:MAG: hypothetical protein IJH12_08780 [Clostridia bacterium]|nr:hypothetical protein [Clostridia bacterium]